MLPCPLQADDLEKIRRTQIGQSGPKDKMRSSKSRSRSKPNRPRTLGNITNRVFDSSGPEGKVRGTPQQIIEKYQQLARDAQLSNDRVAAENFSQHAEHYTRMLAEANRELAAEQEQRQQYQQNTPQSGGYGQQNGGQNGGQNNGNQQTANQQNSNRDRQGDRDYRNDRGDYRGDQRGGDQPDLDGYTPIGQGFDGGNDDEAGLVELPEAIRQQPRRDDNRRDDNRRDDNRRDDNRAREPRQDLPRRENDTPPRDEIGRAHV